MNQSRERLYEGISSQLIGKYQLKNLKGVFKAIDVLNSLGFVVSDSAIKKGISEVVSLTGLKGRWQILDKEPLTICDTGHNEHGIKIVLNQIEKLFSNGLVRGELHFILGFVKDKNVAEILSLFPKDANYYFCEANSPRAMPSDNLIKIAESIGIPGHSILNVNDALAKVREIAAKEDFIYIGGSTFVVAELTEL